MGVANYDVVIVGAGAAGLSAAIGLAKNDFSVLVLEAGAFPGAENWSGCVYFAESLADPQLLGPEGVEALAWERRLVERGIFSANGHSCAGATYRDPAAFRNCYTVLRPIFDHHLAQFARQSGATILNDTTAEGLVRERGRVIGVSTQRGPIYADLVFLAEGDASHLVTKEGLEQAAPGRQDAHFLQGVKQVIEMPAGAIEEIFGVGPEEGVAYEMLLRNGTLRGREANLNMGGFLYTNRDSISLGFVLPLEHLNEGFDGDPNLLMEWLRGIPQIRRWTRDGRPGVFGAKLIRGGGVRDVPHLVDHGLAIGGAASAIGVDFPYPNFTGPATGMGLLLARAAVAIRRAGGSFTLDELKRHYLEPLHRTHWFDDVKHLRRWPSYVEKTQFFFSRNIDALQGSLYVWTRPELGFFAKWNQWVRVIRQTMPFGCWGESISDASQMVQALGLRDVAGYRPIWRVLVDGCVNSVRDLFGRERAHIEPAGQLRWHFSVLGGAEPTAPLPLPVANWGRRFDPVLSAAAREIYRNDPVPLREKLGKVLRVLIDQVNLLDVLAIGAVGFLFAVTFMWQAIADGVRRLISRVARSRTHEHLDLAERWAGDVPMFRELSPQRSLPIRSDPYSIPIARSSATVTSDATPDSWEDKLGRLSYETTKDSHIKVFWPRDLAHRTAVADAGVWHVCPAKVYECHSDSAGQVKLIVNYENCIKCESCWRATDLVDWGRNGGHQLIYRVVTPAMRRLLESLDRTMERRPRPAKARDWWTTALNRLAQRAALSGGNGQFAGELGRLENLGAKIEAKLRELNQSLAAEPRTVDQNRARWIESLATYAKQLVEELVATVREGPLAQTNDAGLRDVQVVLVEVSNSLQAKMAELAQRAYRRQFYWAAADSRQIIGHHLEGLRRVVRLLRGHFAPVPAEPSASARWLQPERAHESTAAFRNEVAATIDAVFDRLAWRAIDTGTTLELAQVEAIKSLCRSVKVTTLAPSVERKIVLTELGRRIPSLAYLVASHFWARDTLRVLGGAAFEELVGRLASGNEIAAFAWEGSVEIDRDDEGVRLRGQKIFVPTALAQWFVVLVDDQLIVLPRETRGLRIEPLGTIGMRGSAPATLVFENVELPPTRRRVDKDQLERLWAVQSSVDLAAIACGMAERLEARAIEHATARVQFPGLFLDDQFRESIGKFGAVKKLLAQIGSRRYLLDTLVHQFAAGDLSDEACRHALELKIVAGDAMNGHPGSVTYNTTQVFGGTGYSEEDFLPMFYRDGSTLATLGVPSATATTVLGQSLLRRRSEVASQTTGQERSSGVLVGLAESAIFDETSQRKALQHELEAVRRLRHEVDSAVTRWQGTAVGDPQAQSLTDVVAEGIGRRQAEFIATESLLLHTHARLETGLSAELEVELLRSWLQDVVDAAHAWVDWLGDPECHVPLPTIQPPALRSTIQTSYQSILDQSEPYQTGDYLIKPFEPAARRYVPELVPFDLDLGRYDRELDELLRANYRDKQFDGLSYERHVERQHKLDPADFELFRQHGFLKMYVPRELGGVGASKAKYNLLVKNLIRNGDVGQTLTVQANTSIGTVPVLIGLFKELPRAKIELAEFRLRADAPREFVRPPFGLDTVLPSTIDVAKLLQSARPIEEAVRNWVGGSPAVRVVCADLLNAIGRLSESVNSSDGSGALAAELAMTDALKRITTREVDEYAEELDRRREALQQFLQWISAGQMTVFALTEPSAGSDTARVATRAVLKTVELHTESDGSYRFVLAASGGDRRLIDARRVEFRPDGAFYRWSDQHEPARIMFDEYDYEADDSDRPRYYMAGPVKVPFHDIAQVRTRDGKPFYDYWELNGAKMWMTNARMAGVMVLYAKTKYGVTSFVVDRHAEGLLVGKNEEKMGQKASVTNELGLQAVRVPRENVNGIEGRGQVNALEALNAGRSGLTTSSATSMEDLISRAEQFALDRYEKLPPPARNRLEEMAEIRFMCEAVACELVVRADHRDTRSFRVEPSIGKMMTSELLMRVIELCEEIYGLEGQTELHNLEKHKRDHRIITVYEGTNEIQRTVILKDLVREIAGRGANSPVGSVILAHSAGSDKLHVQRGMLEEMKRDLHRVLTESVSNFDDEILMNPSMQSVFFGLSDAAAWIKLADAALGRTEWVLRHLDATQDAAYRDWSLRLVRRIVARARHRVRQRLAHVTESTMAFRQGAYPPEIRAASLMMTRLAVAESRVTTRPHEVSRAIQIVVIVELDPTISPTPAVIDGRWNEPYYRLDSADAAALAAARSIAAAATAPARVVVVGAGPRRAAKIMEEALAAGADEAVHVLTDDRTIAPEAIARALARVIDSECRAPDLILARSLLSSTTAGLVGMLIARESGVNFVPSATALTVHFTEDEASALVSTADRAKPQRLSLPVTVGVVGAGDPPRFRIADYLSSLERPIKFVAWPEEISRRFSRLVSSTAVDHHATDVSTSTGAVTPDEAAAVLLEALGLRAEPAAERSDQLLDVPIYSVDRLSVRQPGPVLVICGTDGSGRLRPAERRAVRAASALARSRNLPLAALVFTPNDESAERRAATELAGYGASFITAAVPDPTPDSKNAPEMWSRILIDRWSPDWTGFGAVVASLWAEPALARFGARHAELTLRVSRLTPGPNTLLAQFPRVEGKIHTQRELPTNDGKPIWITTTESIECELPLLAEVLEPRVERWPVAIGELPSRRELLDLLSQVRDEVGVSRLADADFIIDAGFGLGSIDGFGEIVPPLETTLHEIGVAHVAVGGSRKVTEELKVLPPSAQIGQTGQSVNPTILLAIGISGAPQHLNYIGQRATILAFNRDPEAPIMTLNQRQPQPRVFPIVGDLFQTVPAFTAALREFDQPIAPEREPALAR
jgi:electron transfer flavoprotein-quinone oxidoreductase